MMIEVHDINNGNARTVNTDHIVEMITIPLNNHPDATIITLDHGGIHMTVRESRERIADLHNEWYR